MNPQKLELDFEVLSDTGRTCGVTLVLVMQ